MTGTARDITLFLGDGLVTIAICLLFGRVGLRQVAAATILGLGIYLIGRSHG